MFSSDKSQIEVISKADFISETAGGTSRSTKEFSTGGPVSEMVHTTAIASNSFKSRPHRENITRSKHSGFFFLPTLSTFTSVSPLASVVQVASTRNGETRFENDCKMPCRAWILNKTVNAVFSTVVLQWCLHDPDEVGMHPTCEKPLQLVPQNVMDVFFSKWT